MDSKCENILLSSLMEIWLKIVLKVILEYEDWDICSHDYY